MELQLSAEDVMYQRRKNRWMSYGRALIAICALGLITVILIVLTRTSFSDKIHSMDSGDLKQMSYQEIEVENHVDADKVLIREIVKRSVSFPYNAITNNSRSKFRRKLYRKNSLTKSLDVKKTLNLKKIKNFNHSHSDGQTYFLQGYTCVPIFKLPKYLEMSRNTQSGTL